MRVRAASKNEHLVKVACLNFQRVDVKIADEDVSRLRHRLRPISRIRTARRSVANSSPLCDRLLTLVAL